MKNALVDDKGTLVITPSPASAATDFDFLMGKHTVHHRKLTARLAGSNDWVEFDGTHTMEALLGGLGNLEQHKMLALDGKPVEGIALRLFNPVTKLWTIYWADSRFASLDDGVRGSFENNTGYFYAKDSFNSKPILIQFKWDATNPDQPVWSQAFSADNGATWEWNWYMYFTKELSINKTPAAGNQTPVADDAIGIIELRNYLLQKGKRDAFVDYFENNFITPQEQLHARVKGRYRIKDNADNFCWIRGFSNMQARSKFLPAFYYSDFWKQHRDTANSMIANNDNVYLLTPLQLQQDTLAPVAAISSVKLNAEGRIAVVDFYISNTKRAQLIKLFGKEYLPLLNRCGINDYTIWVSEQEENDFPALPVFQDKNLLVVITFYQDEAEYGKQMQLVNAGTGFTLKAALQDAITTRQTMVLYPAGKKQ